MARPASRFVCQSCAAVYGKWQGRCDSCSQWNTIAEDVTGHAGGAVPGSGEGRRIPLAPLAGTAGAPPRLTTGLAEFDRVSGGGLVAGSAILVGGDPGIGKSTLLMQVAGAVSHAAACVYISGEEAVDQVRMRAERLGLSGAPVQVAAATNIRDIAATFDAADTPRLLVVDSIQTMHLDSLESAPGTVSQVRAAADVLIRLAKRRGFSLILVGHVTKEGTIAGPRVLEHMVDTVLYFEGDRGHHFRILRAIKNRFGPTDEIGVFEMTGAGLVEVGNPSALFLAQHRDAVAGNAVFAAIEGTRPVLVEIQALVAAAAPGTPRRAVIGWDAGRLAMVLAVLEARCGISLAGRDVFLNVVGGLRVSEPAADLAVAAALISATLDDPVASSTIVIGEIGLSGEVRSVTQTGLRLREASKLGFGAAWIPARQAGSRDVDRADVPEMKIVEISRLRDLASLFGRAGGAIPETVR